MYAVKIRATGEEKTEQTGFVDWGEREESDDA